MNRVVHFEIHAEDPERAAEFYKGVFGWEIKKWESPDFDMSYWMIMTEKESDKNKEKDKWPGINGGMVIRKGPAPIEGQPINAYVCTIDVENLDKCLGTIQDFGGTLALPKMPIPGVGWLAYCKDTEGNIFGIMQDDKNAK